MIENFNWVDGEWISTGYNKLKDFIKEHTRDRPCKIHNTNQDDFDNVYLYYYDNMGHMWLIRMPENDYVKEWYGDNGLGAEQRKDYEIFTDKNGYASKIPHVFCGVCDRCKTCGDCKCKDKHKR